MNKQEQIAYEKGIAEGRAEMTDENYDVGWKEGLEEGLQRSQTTEKQAYTKGVADGKAEEKINLQKKSYQQLKFYDSGYEQGQSDIKARLILIIQKDHDLCESCYIDLEEALAEATKGGDK